VRSSPALKDPTNWLQALQGGGTGFSDENDDEAIDRNARNASVASQQSLTLIIFELLRFLAGEYS